MWLVHLLNTLVVVLAFIISVVEAVYEGVKGAGEQKKTEALQQWAKVRSVLREVIQEAFGERATKLFDALAHEKLISVFIDVLVWWFNRTGFFPKP